MPLNLTEMTDQQEIQSVNTVY